MGKYSASEQYVVDLIDRQRAQIMGMSIVEFAEFANVSTATIVRTMKKMGYSGYTDFRHSAGHPGDEEPAVLRAADDNIRQVITANLREVQQTINSWILPPLRTVCSSLLARRCCTSLPVASRR